MWARNLTDLLYYTVGVFRLVTSQQGVHNIKKYVSYISGYEVLLSVSCCLFISCQILTNMVDIVDWLRNVHLHLSFAAGFCPIVAYKCKSEVE
jgi:hypothetical protein